MTSAYPETLEAAAFAPFKEILEADPSLTSRASNQLVASYMLDTVALPNFADLRKENCADCRLRQPPVPAPRLRRTSRW